MAKTVYRQIPTPRDLPQHIPVPRVKIRMQKLQSGGKILGAIPWGEVTTKSDSSISFCITHLDDYICLEIDEVTENSQ